MPAQTMTEKDQYAQAIQREATITQRLLAQFPGGKEDFKPAEKSSSARNIVWMFPSEEKLVEILLEGAPTPMGAPPAPQIPVAEIAKMYDAQHRAFLDKLRTVPAGRFDVTVPFPTGKNQMGEKRIGEVAWFMLQDHIHHRGQLSVYLRILGAKVPSIYGPSADEPWR